MNTHFTTNNASSSANKKLSWQRQLRPQISCVSVNGSLMVKVNKTNRSIRILISFIGNHRKIPLLYGNFKLPSLLWEYAFYGLKALSFCSAISGFMATKNRYKITISCGAQKLSIFYLLLTCHMQETCTVQCNGWIYFRVLCLGRTTWY